MRSRSMDPFFPPRPPASAPVSSPLPSGRTEQGGVFRLLGDMKQDDYILLGIIALLFFEGSDDYILLAALGYLYIMGIM